MASKVCWVSVRILCSNRNIVSLPFYEKRHDWLTNIKQISTNRPIIPLAKMRVIRVITPTLNEHPYSGIFVQHPSVNLRIVIGYYADTAQL